ncbi:hypothetical protein [Phenylobacterium sp.]|uniref:hypothetical protein n=1 Tax=Phenylobacterium sp. TaxID=1871053 RepID=UPI0030F4AA2B
MIIQFIPSIILGILYAIVVFLVARKRRINPWGWTIATLIPIIGLVVAAVFFCVTLLSILDRLNGLEGISTPKVSV